MNFNEYQDPQLLDKIIQFLNIPVPKEASAATLWSLGSKLYTNVTRVTNKAFADGVWYDESKARLVLLDYINNPECTKVLSPQHRKIMLIYERLAQLSRGKGTWADGIDKSLLQANEPASMLEDDFFLLMPDIKAMALENVFLPEAPEEQIFQAQAPQKKDQLPDPKAQVYRFVYQKEMKAPDHRMLFHIHADEFGKGSQLEGGRSSDAVQYVHQFLKRVKQTYPETLQEELDNSLDMQYDPTPYNNSDSLAFVGMQTGDKIKVAQEKIEKAFQTKHPLLIIGGWTGNPSGHAIYYEIIPDSNKKATFRLYNTGAGIEEHPSALKGHKLKYQAYVDWKGIDRRQFESPYFLQALYELKSYKTLPDMASSTAYNEDDVYKSLKELLQPAIVESGSTVSIDDPSLMTPQRSGVCSWKSLMAFMRTKIPLNDYKRFKCDIKLQSLLDFVNAHPSTNNPIDWRLVKRSHENLSRAIAKLYRAGLVGDAYLDTIQPQLEGIAAWIKKHADCRYKRAIKSVPAKFESSVDPKIIENAHADSEPLAKSRTSEKAVSGLQPCHYTFDAIKGLDFTQPKLIRSELEKLNVLCDQAWKGGEDVALNKGLVDCVTRLSMEESFWTQAIDKQQEAAEELVILLGKMSQVFFKSCYTVPEPYIIFAERIYLFTKLLYIQEMICRIGMPQWKALELIDEPMRSTFLLYSNGQMQNEIKRINFKARPKLRVAIDHYFGRYETTLSKYVAGLSFYFEESEVSKQNFQEIVRKVYPEIIAELIKSEERFNQLGKHAQDARIYTTDKLPEWLKAIRNTQIAYHQLSESAVGPISSLDRSNHLSPVFSIEDQNKKSQVTISFAGLDAGILSLKEVKECSDNSASRFTKQFLENPSSSIQVFFEYRNTSLLEKEVAITSSKHISSGGLSLEDYKDIARIYTNPTLKLIEFVEYLTKHPDKLRDTGFQLLFQATLYEMGQLETNLAVPGFERLLEHFFSQFYANFSEENDIQPAVYLLRNAHLLRTFCPNAPFFKQTTAELKKLIKRQGIEEDAKTLLYAELNAQLGSKERLDEEEIAYLIAGSIFIEENRSSGKFPIDPTTNKEAGEALQIHARQLREQLELGNPNHTLLNQLLKMVRPQLKQDYVWVEKKTPGQFPVFETNDGAHLIFPLSSQLVSTEAQTLLPIKLRQNPLFKQLFPTVEKGTYRAGNIFSFKDSFDRETLVSLKGDHLVIEQKLEGEWVRYVPASLFLYEAKGPDDRKEIRSRIGSRYLAQHFSHWQSLTPGSGRSQIYVTDPKTGRRCYQLLIREKEPYEVEHRMNAEYNAEVEKIKKQNAFYPTPERRDFNNKEDIRRLNLKKIDVDRSRSYFEVDAVINPSENLRLAKSSSFFTHFEDPTYIHEWYDSDNKLKKIELPRFQLSFTPNPQDPTQLLSDQFEGYHLNTVDSLKQLGGHHHFILLQKGNQQKVLLPSHLIKASSEKEVLKPRYELERNLGLEQLDQQSYYLFDVEKGGKLFSKSREANLYLALASAAAQEYKQAVDYLKRYGTKLSAYTTNELEILKALGSLDETTGDISGNGTIVQLYANYLKLKNLISHQQQLSDNDFTIVKHYDRYLERYKNVTEFKLKKEEEIYLLKLFLNRSFNPVHFLRLKELDSRAASKIQLPTEPLSSSEPVKRKSLGEFKIPIPVFSSFQVDFSKLLLTRYHSEIDNHFLEFYELARNGSAKQQERLRQAIPFIRSAEKGVHAGKANFFEALLDHPGSFPAPPSKEDRDNNYNTLRNWQSQVQLVAEKILSSKPVVREAKVKQDRSTGFYLGKDLEVKKEVKWQSTVSHLQGFSNECRDLFNKGPEKEPQIGQLSVFLDSCHRQDPVHNREVDRLINDLTIYQKEKSEVNFSINDEGISKLKSILAKDKFPDEATLENYPKEILKLANKFPGDPALRAQTTLDRWGKNKRVITLEELIVCFARQEFGSLLNRNPALNEADLIELSNKIGSYLLHAVRHQKRTRAEELLTKLETCQPNEKGELTNQLAQETLSVCPYEPSQRPAYLVFEYLEKIALRDAQVQKLEKFLSGKHPNIVMEMIMGSGKSKVLLPLLGLMRADGKTLSLLIVPQPLFESISQDTQEKLQGFSQSLSTLHFDRHTAFTKERLESIYDELKNIQTNRECLIMTSKSVQCLIIKFIEECAHHLKMNKNKELSIELKLMQKVLKLLSESGYPIIDEADTVLNILHEVSFSGGELVAPKPHELEFLSGLFGLVYESPVIKEIARIESYPHPNLKAPPLTEQSYQEKLIVPMAKAVVDLLGKFTFESNRALTDKMQAYVAKLDEASRQHLLHYLCREKGHSASAQRYFDSLDPEIQDILALAGEEVAHLLPFTLTKLSDEKYGLDNRSHNPLAIPYSAANIPNYGSQFSNFHITMNYTHQYYAKKGVTVELVKEQVALLQEKAMREVAGGGGKISIRETEAGKAFEKMKGDVNMPLFNYKAVDIDNLTAEINRNPHLKRFFVTHIILPQLELFEYKITCNPHNLVSFFRRVDGFTGTLWNGVSMHHTLKPEPAAGTDAKTLTILWKNSRDNAVVVKEGALSEVLKQLNEHSIAFDVIADAGGYFKEAGNSQLAHVIAASQKKEVVFYNTKGEQTITEGIQEQPFSQSKTLPHNRLTFLDQSHTTGADVPQKRDAVGLVTIGRNMLLRDLLQSVWRLRGLDKSQSVRFLISEEVAGIMRQKLELPPDYPLQLEAILKFVIGNQAIQQGRDNYKALGEGFQNIAQRILLQVLMNEKLTPDARLQAMAVLRSAWIKPAFATSKEMYGQLTTKIDAEKVVAADKLQYEAKIKEMFQRLPWLERAGIAQADCLKEINTIAARIINHLAQQLQVPKAEIDDDQTVEVEREVKTETEREVQLEAQDDNTQADDRIFEAKSNHLMDCETFADAVKELQNAGTFGSYGTGISYAELSGIPVFPLKSYMEFDPLYRSYASIFDGVHIVLNILEFSHSQAKEFKLLGSHRMDFHHLLVKDSKVTLLTQREAVNQYKNPDYYNLTLGFLDKNRKLKTDELLKIIKIKFLNGESYYSSEEMKLLRMWIKQSGVEKMQKLFVESILKGYPKRAARYQNSPLQQIFASIPS